MGSLVEGAPHAPGLESDFPGLPSQASYVVPLATDEQDIRDLAGYLATLESGVEVIVVDGSAEPAFEAHRAQLRGVGRHAAVPALMETSAGKVGGVLTGVRMARNERVVIADDDVRYDLQSLCAVVQALERADVVRPQNYFDPMPWHAAWDTGRSLVNRALDGDWPGTLGVRRSAVMDAGGYAGDALFENLELVRTLKAGGGIELVAREILVARRPPKSRHFWSQRVRQAYDEFARPHRLLVSLGLLPAFIAIGAKRARYLLLVGATSVAVAEIGRRRAGGQRVFPAWTPLMAPVWLAERSVCSWLAVGSRLIFGGARYRGVVLRRAANSQAHLDRTTAAMRSSRA